MAGWLKGLRKSETRETSAEYRLGLQKEILHKQLASISEERNQMLAAVLEADQPVAAQSSMQKQVQELNEMESIKRHQLSLIEQMGIGAPSTSLRQHVRRRLIPSRANV